MVLVKLSKLLTCLWVVPLGRLAATMSDIAFEVLEGAIKEMERAHLGIDAIVHALVAQALHFAYCRVGEDTAKGMLRDAVEEAISAIEALDVQPPH
jgi:hypothetical protein